MELDLLKGLPDLPKGRRLFRPPEGPHHFLSKRSKTKTYSHLVFLRTGSRISRGRPKTAFWSWLSIFQPKLRKHCSITFRLANCVSWTRPRLPNHKARTSEC